MNFHFNFSFLPTLIFIGILVYLFMKRETDEENLVFKFIGYALLGGFHLNLNGLILPVGILIYFFFLKPTVNVKTKRYVTLTAFIFMLIGAIFPLF
jgi:hypothetical protein